MSINERLKTIIEEQYNGNKRAFSMAIGVTPTVIENVVAELASYTFGLRLPVIS